MSTPKSISASKTDGAAPKTSHAKKPAAKAAKIAKAAAPRGAVSAGSDATAAPKQKNKLVRDSFTIPKSEYTVLDALKQRAVKLAQPARKSEILRAGIGALNAMTDKAFLAALGAIPSLKTGRPPGAQPAAKNMAV